MSFPDIQRTRSPVFKRFDAGWRLIFGYALSYLPRLSGASVARRLIRRAQAARAARDFRLAATLYEEALAIAPGRIHLHIQCGHMLKESGDFAAAERHYRTAELLLPDDADLALQIGHFFKVTMRPDDAATAYARALALRPGWQEAGEELALVQGSIAAGERGVLASDTLEWIIPELLPRSYADGTVGKDQIRVFQLAPRRQRSADGMVKILHGIEAIRGYCISSKPLDELQVTLNDNCVARYPLRSEAPDRDGRTKYVFNLWHDFSQVAPGSYIVDLRMMAGSSVLRTYRDHVWVVSKTFTDTIASDGFVPPFDPTDNRSMVERINALPSIARPARRSLLPSSVRTILVQRADQLGDLVCSVPAIQRLREGFPEARLIGVLTPANADLGQRLGLFDEVVVADFAEVGGTGRRVLTIAAQERLHADLLCFNFDIAIDLCENSDSRPLLLLSNARFLYGFKPREWPWLTAGFEMNARDPVNGLETIAPARKILAMVEALIALKPVESTGYKSAGDSSLIARHGIAEGERYVVLHSGARLAFSRWPGFAALADRLAEEKDLKIIFMQDDGCTAQPSPSPQITVLSGRLPFEEFDALIGSCAAFVGNDSGIKHLAALRGRPVVSLHMARRNWSEWGQEGEGLIISRRVPCAGCGIHRHPEECGQDFACIRHISVDDVRNAVLQLL